MISFHTCLRTSQIVTKAIGRIRGARARYQNCSELTAVKPYISSTSWKPPAYIRKEGRNLRGNRVIGKPRLFTAIERKRTVCSSMMVAVPPAAPDVLRVERVPCLNDNYSWVIHDPSTGSTGVVDPAEDGPVENVLKQNEWKLTHIFNTHHHWDHTGANMTLKKKYNCKIIGPYEDRDRIPGIDIEMKDGDSYKFGEVDVLCFDTPGHTKGHITFYIESAKALFPGDTLFALGCGRLFEGTPEQMWSSMNKFLVLPEDTRVYCAHEYTQSNAKFAIAVDKDNMELQKRGTLITEARSRNEPTIPSLLGEEMRTNPFLRPSDSNIRAALGIPLNASDSEAFGAIRKAKDNFR